MNISPDLISSSELFLGGSSSPTVWTADLVSDGGSNPLRFAAAVSVPFFGQRSKVRPCAFTCVGLKREEGCFPCGTAVVSGRRHTCSAPSGRGGRLTQVDGCSKRSDRSRLASTAWPKAPTTSCHAGSATRKTCRPALKTVNNCQYTAFVIHRFFLPLFRQVLSPCNLIINSEIN